MTPISNIAGNPHPVAAASRRLRLSINWSLGVLFLCLLGLTTLGLWLRYQEVVRDAGRNAGNLTRIFSEDMAVRFDTIAAALDQLAAYSRRSGGPDSPGEGWIQILSAVQSGLTAIESLTVVDGTGAATYSTHMETMSQSHAGGLLYRELSANPMSDKLVVDAPLRSLVDARPVIPVGRVIRKTSGAFEGMLIATLAPSRLHDFYRSADVGPNGIVWILHPSGKTLLRQPSIDPMGEPWPALPIAATASAAGNSGLVRGPVETGGPAFVTAFQADEETGLVIAASLAVGDILLPWWTEVYRALAGLAVFGLALLTVGIFVARSTRTMDEA